MIEHRQKLCLSKANLIHPSYNTFNLLEIQVAVTFIVVWGAEHLMVQKTHAKNVARRGLAVRGRDLLLPSHVHVEYSRDGPVGSQVQLL